jgi:Alginate export
LKYRLMATAAAMILAGCGTGAYAQSTVFGDFGKPIDLGDGTTLDPILALNLRYEGVDQANIANTADAFTVRARFGAELKSGGFFLLAEGEGTLALSDDYNDTLPFNGAEPFPTVADPENFELNRLQAGYMKDGNGVTIGRQRIVLDNARFVGNVGWRQNEQTYDAIRGQAKVGPVKLDATYAISQRTIFGVDSPNEHFDGDFVFLNAATEVKPVKVSAFAYLLDYDTRVAFSSQTYGVYATASLPVAKDIKLDLLASFAGQSDMGGNPVSYNAEYFTFEAGVTVGGFSLKGGYEELGSDGGVAAFQTPLATLHAFNGWADLFLTTPAKGLQDTYATVAYKFDVKALPGLNAALTYHTYDSDFGGIDYGDEINASIGVTLHGIAFLVKYADYDADMFGNDTEKFWIQAALGF